MARNPSPRLLMLGPAADTHGAVARVVEAYRAAGLFKRWPAEYLATHAPGAGVRRNAALALAAMRQLAAVLARERELVVHVHAQAGAGFWREALFMALALAGRGALIVHLHGEGFQRLRDAGPLGRRVIGFLLERAACVLVPCESLRAWVAGFSRRAQVAALSEPVAAAPEAPAHSRHANLVLFLSRLEPSSGVFDLIEALAGVRAAVPDVRLVCAGEGDRGALRSHAERLGIADAVTFTGWVGPSGRRALLESAAVFALPSYDEALPMAVLEAMACAIPVVATSAGSVPEALADGTTGFLVAPGDVATLQRVLRKLLLDAGLRARVGAAARESVRLRCAPERVLDRLEALYASFGLQSAGAVRPPVAPAGLNEAA